MTPPAFATTPGGALLDMADAAELVSELTFDELRELPASVQMGLDLTACESEYLD